MTEREIVGVRESNGTITHVAVLTPVDDVWLQIEKEEAIYTTKKGGTQTKVYGRTAGSGHKFLTTNPDDTKANNLDFQNKV